MPQLPNVRVQAIAAVQEKVLRLNGATLSHISTGHIVNLVSNDVRRFDEAGPFWVFTWAGPLETCIVLALIAAELGIVPAVAGIATLLAIVPLQAGLASKIAGLRMAAAKGTDERVRLTGAPLDPLFCECFSPRGDWAVSPRVLTRAAPRLQW